MKEMKMQWSVKLNCAMRKKFSTIANPGVYGMKGVIKISFFVVMSSNSCLH